MLLALNKFSQLSDVLCKPHGKTETIPIEDAQNKMRKDSEHVTEKKKRNETQRKTVIGKRQKSYKANTKQLTKWLQ